MINPPNHITRLECVRLLGGYEPSKKIIIRYLQDKRESPDLRYAAATTLHANDPDNFVNYIKPVVRDEDAPDRLRIYAIKAEMLRRNSNQFRSKHKKPDDFDRIIRQLPRDSRSMEVRRAAQKYLDELNSKF